MYSKRVLFLVLFLKKRFMEKRTLVRYTIYTKRKNIFV